MSHRTAIFILVAGFVAIGTVGAESAHRDSSQRQMFVRRFPCPAAGPKTCFQKGYVIDHIHALGCGGPDIWQNMQWQTIKEAKEKDSAELDGCKREAK